MIDDVPVRCSFYLKHYSNDITVIIINEAKMGISKGHFLSYLLRHSLRMSMNKFLTFYMSFPMDCVSLMKSLKIICHFEFDYLILLHFC